MRTQAISVATRLSHVGDIARAVDADESALHRLLRYLASEGIFEEDAERQFSERLSPSGSGPTLLRRHGGWR